MLRKEALIIFLLLSVLQIKVCAEPQDQVCEETIVRSKGCKKLCSINVLDSQNIRGNLTVGGAGTSRDIKSGNVNIAGSLIVNGQNLGVLSTFGIFSFNEPGHPPITPVAIAPNNPIPILYPFAGSTIASNIDGTEFILPSAGSYLLSLILNTEEVSAQVSVFINGSEQLYTRTFKNNSGQLFITTIVNTVAVDSLLSIVNTGLSVFTVTNASLSLQALS